MKSDIGLTLFPCKPPIPRLTSTALKLRIRSRNGALTNMQVKRPTRLAVWRRWYSSPGTKSSMLCVKNALHSRYARLICSCSDVGSFFFDLKNVSTLISSQLNTIDSTHTGHGLLVLEVNQFLKTKDQQIGRAAILQKIAKEACILVLPPKMTWCCCTCIPCHDECFDGGKLSKFGF